MKKTDPWKMYAGSDHARMDKDQLGNNTPYDIQCKRQSLIIISWKALYFKGLSHFHTLRYMIMIYIYIHIKILLTVISVIIVISVISVITVI